LKQAHTTMTIANQVLYPKNETYTGISTYNNTTSCTGS